MKNILALIIFLATTALAQSPYCGYVEKVVDAQRDILLSPKGEAGLTQQPIENGVPQIYVGASESLANVFKSHALTAAMRKDCALYEVTVELQKKLTYTLPFLEKQSLETRTVLLKESILKIEALIQENSEKVELHNSTIQASYSLQTAKIKMENDLAFTKLQLINLADIPVLNNEPIPVLLARKLSLEVEKQKADGKVSKYDNWDVSATIGVRRDALINGNLGAYGGITASYSFGSKKRDSDIDQVSNLYETYMQTREDGESKIYEHLKKQLHATLQASKEALDHLKTNKVSMETQLKLVEDLDTPTSIIFAAQIKIDLIQIDVEIGVLEAKISNIN